ncbi:MAG: ATP-dependent RecD-like DNA helicase [Anaerolineaceae bacterium]|nr:ATP-dependent RecD-like DNA helicase [Anaerolineaceae bacterium]
MATLRGRVARVTFRNPENGYAVLRLEAQGRTPSGARNREGRVTVVGVMPQCNVGEELAFGGEWIEDARYGTQFRAETATPLPPVGERGITSYLSGGLVRGIGPRTAERIVEHFGADTLTVLEEAPERLTEVLRPALAQALADAWRAQQDSRHALIFLQEQGVSGRMAQRIHEQLGMETIPAVQANPWTLANEVYGIGFRRADEIARNMGKPADAAERLRAGLRFALSEMTKEGHVFAPREQLLEKAADLLTLDDPTALEAVLDGALQAGDLVREDGIEVEGQVAIYLPEWQRAESEAARRLGELARTPSTLSQRAARLDWARLTPALATKDDAGLTAEQEGAVQAACAHKLSVLTGGPGTGKTTTLKGVIAALETLKVSVALCSPTGRAARRLAQASGRNASTIHRLLGYSPAEGFERNEDNPLELDALIVDEASMIDLQLFHYLLRALPPAAHLLLVGDVDQLPSVGAGNVLRDVIACGLARVTRLSFIFRQDADSGIVSNAHRINRGQMPLLDNRRAGDFFFLETDAERIVADVVGLVRTRLPRRYGLDPLRDIQVIAPMYRGAAGINALNEALQGALNGDRRRAAREIGGRSFRVGDKVMQTRNNYEKEVFNGDIGFIHAIDENAGGFEVVMDGRFLFYEWVEAEELLQAWCISTHRSQGSEYPAVVMPLLTQHYMMLQRNLLYTAITRAQRLVVIPGSRAAIGMALRNNQVAERHSGLVPRIQAMSAG